MASLQTRVTFLENRTDLNERLLEQAREEYRDGRARLEGEMSELRTELRNEMRALRAEMGEMRSDILTLSADMRSEILGLSVEMRRKTRWTAALAFGAVASLSILLPVCWQLAQRWL